MISPVYYYLDMGVPIDQEKDFQRFCDEQNKKRDEEIKSLKNYDNARLALMKIDSCKIEINDLKKELKKQKEQLNDITLDGEKLITSINTILTEEYKNCNDDSISNFILNILAKINKVEDEYKNAPYCRLCEKLKKIEEENNWNKKN